MSAYSVDEWQTCDVFNTIAKLYGDDAATKFMRALNRTRLERLQDAEMMRNKRLIALAEKQRTEPEYVNTRGHWLITQEKITRSFAALDRLAKEYESA